VPLLKEMVVGPEQFRKLRTGRDYLYITIIDGAFSMSVVAKIG
jgi:hypothetical protein